MLPSQPKEHDECIIVDITKPCVTRNGTTIEVWNMVDDALNCVSGWRDLCRYYTSVEGRSVVHQECLLEAELLLLSCSGCLSGGQ